MGRPYVRDRVRFAADVEHFLPPHGRPLKLRRRLTDHSGGFFAFQLFTKELSYVALDLADLALDTVYDVVA